MNNQYDYNQRLNNTFFLTQDQKNSTILKLNRYKEKWWYPLVIAVSNCEQQFNEWDTPKFEILRLKHDCGWMTAVQAKLINGSIAQIGIPHEFRKRRKRYFNAPTLEVEQDFLDRKPELRQGKRIIRANKLKAN